MRWTIAVLVLLLPSVASAQPDVPAFCGTVNEAGYYAIGVRKGRSLAQQVIARATDPADVCASVEGLTSLRATVQAVVDALYVSPGASNAVRCHVAGQVAGLVAQLEELVDECMGRCASDGLLAGGVAAHLYCGLAGAFDGLAATAELERLPTGACGTAWQTSCDLAWATVAAAPSCVAYTTGAYAAAYAAVRASQCAGNPGELPAL